MDPKPAHAPPSHLFLPGGGELGTLFRSKDWQSTALGTPEKWPHSLRTAVNILLTSRYAMWLGWGEPLSFIYNDAYRPTLGIKHPWALGTPASLVWAEIWKEIGPRIQTVLSTGVATFDKGLMLFLERSGFPEETYHTFSYSPLPDDEGSIRGMLCVVTEETERVIGERRMETLRDLASALALCNSESEVLAAVCHILSSNSKDLPFTLVYLCESGSEARLACSTHVPAGHALAPDRLQSENNLAPWPIGDLLRHPPSRMLCDLSEELHPLPQGPWDKPPKSAAVMPLKYQGQDRTSGFLAVGLNPYQRFDEAYSGFLDLVAGQVTAGLSNAKAYEQERQRSEALAELDRAKTAFFSNVSHEFRTPLTLMLGPVEDLLARESANSTDGRQLLEVIHRSGLRLQRLVNTLLDFSRIEAGRAQAQFQPTDLSHFTADLASSFRSAMERAGLQYSVECDAVSQTVYVDREMWEKIVLNLISNAFKYTLEGFVAVRLQEQADGVEFSVTDSGAGIPAEELPHLFERFHRVEQTRGRTHEGTGIGLALVQELVTLHGGNVSVTSTLGTGSKFSVFLRYGKLHLSEDRLADGRAPLSDTPQHAISYVEEALRWLPESAGPKAVAGSVETKEAGHSHASRSRILLVDDNADMRDYIFRLLSPEYSIVTAANGEEALRKALESPPDLILSDVMMPILDGFGLLRSLRENPLTRSLPVILLSARAGEEASLEGLSAGADDYLVKPFTARELLARVGAHLALRRERLRAQERLTQIFQQAPVGIVVFRGEDFIAELANPVSLNMLRGRKVVGLKIRDVMPDLSPDVWAAFQCVYRTGKPFVANDFYVPYDQDGDGIIEDHWFNVVYHPLEEADGSISGVIAVMAEVTEQVLARKDLEKANRELEEFAYVSSHDLQEPLRMISIYTQLLTRRYLPDDGEAHSFSNYIREGVRRMEELLKDLLIYSRIVHPEQEPAGSVDLDKALDEALQVLQLRMDEVGAVIVREPLPQAFGEERQLALVFQNLISNAIKYSPDGPPKVVIAVKPGPEDQEELTITVADYGIGFDPRYSDRIFGLFKRLHKDAYPGTGLGLAICKRIVERYGGKIWAESAGEGLGATFSFSLRKPGPRLDQN